MTPQTTASTLEVFADVGCPFTHLSLQMLVKERVDRGVDSPVLVIKAWPLELVNDAAIDPEMIADEVVDLREQVDGEAFVGFDPDEFPATTVPAMELTARAYAADVQTGEAVALACRRLLFDEGVDVSDPGVLEAIAAEHGLDASGLDEGALVRADYAAGRERGVVGSPHFFMPDDDWFCPSLDIRRSGGRLKISFDRQGFETLVERSFPA